MKEQNNVIEYLKRIEKPYQLQVGDMVVEMAYSDNNKKFNECILNILKQKSKMS